MIRRAVLAGLLTAVVVGCGSQASPVALPSIAVHAAPLATSLVTPQGAWGDRGHGQTSRLAEQLLAAVRASRGRQQLVAGHAAGRG